MSNLAFADSHGSRHVLWLTMTTVHSPLQHAARFTLKRLHDALCAPVPDSQECRRTRPEARVRAAKGPAQLSSRKDETKREPVRVSYSLGTKED